MCVPTDLSEEPEQSADMPLEVYGREDFNTNATFPTVTTETLPANTSFIDFDDDADQLEFILMVLIPLILFALLFLSVIILVTRYRRKRAKQGNHFVCSHFQTIASCVNEQSVNKILLASTQSRIAQDLRVPYRHVSMILTPVWSWGWGRKEPRVF